MKIDFKHRQSAHCESGVCSNLLHHKGIDISEAMAFGVGAGLFFGYIPFIKINKLPLTTYRNELGGIFKKVTRKLGVKYQWQSFRRHNAAMDALDEKLEEGIPVACRTGGYWLPYFPPAFRFHFNMHNLVVIGKKGDEYLISDPVFPDIVRCPAKDLIKARFSKGALAPKGTMYYLTHVPDSIDLKPAIIKGIKQVCHRMLHTPGPIIGVRGIRFLANQLEKWPKKLGKRRSILYLGQIIRMQEEIGTGGGGFRFMYAAFLQEAADQLKNDHLMELSADMTKIGDRWREFAVIGARNCKNRASATDTFEAMAEMLRDCARREEDLCKDLLKTVH